MRSRACSDLRDGGFLNSKVYASLIAWKRAPSSIPNRCLCRVAKAKACIPAASQRLKKAALGSSSAAKMAWRSRITLCTFGDKVCKALGAEDSCGCSCKSCATASPVAACSVRTGCADSKARITSAYCVFRASGSSARSATWSSCIRVGSCVPFASVDRNAWTTLPALCSASALVVPAISSREGLIESRGKEGRNCTACVTPNKRKCNEFTLCK